MYENMWAFVSKEWDWPSIKPVLRNMLANLAVASANDIKDVSIGGYFLDPSQSIIFSGKYKEKKAYVIITRLCWGSGSDIVLWFDTYVFCEDKKLLETELYELFGKHVDSDIQGMWFDGEINFRPIKIIEKGGKLEFNTI